MARKLLNMKNENNNKSKIIFVVDDDPGILDAFQAMLESDGYEVTATSKPDSLFKLGKKNLPGLIFLDVLLSGVDGRQICKQLKANSNLKKIPVIMVSAAPNIEKSVKEAGADDFITKPFEMDNLLGLVKNYLKKWILLY